MTEVQGLDVTARRRRRGMVRASITKLAAHFDELERKLELSHSDRLAAQPLHQRLASMAAEFKGYHLAIVDLLQEEEELEGEQAILDDHDDKVAGLFDRLAYLNTPVEHEIKAKPDP